MSAKSLRDILEEALVSLGVARAGTHGDVLRWSVSDLATDLAEALGTWSARDAVTEMGFAEVEPLPCLAPVSRERFGLPPEQKSRKPRTRAEELRCIMREGPEGIGQHPPGNEAMIAPQEIIPAKLAEFFRSCDDHVEERKLMANTLSAELLGMLVDMTPHFRRSYVAMMVESTTSDGPRSDAFDKKIEAMVYWSKMLDRLTEQAVQAERERFLELVRSVLRQLTREERLAFLRGLECCLVCGADTSNTPCWHQDEPTGA